MASYLLSLILAASVTAAALYLTAGDPLSVFFVTLAVATAVLLLGGLLMWERQLRAVLAQIGGGEALTIEKLDRTPLAGVGASFQGTLVKDPLDPKGELCRTQSAIPLIRPESIAEFQPPAWLPSGQALLVSLGLFGTFFGLSYGLLESIPCIDQQDARHAECVAALPARATEAKTASEVETQAMERGMSILLGGARTAFSKSVAGIGLGVAWLLLWRQREEYWRRRILDIGERLDAGYPYRPAALLLLDRVESLERAQPDGAAFQAAAGSIAAAVRSLEGAAGALLQAGNRMAVAAEGFGADVLGRKVSEGMEGAIQRQLRPPLERVDEALRNLEAIKRSTDEEVKLHLRQILDDLRRDAISPLAQELQATNANVRTVAHTVAEVAASTRGASEAVAGLGLVLAQFQQESLARLEGFAQNLQQSIGEFHNRSLLTFGQVTGTLQIAGQEAAAILTQAGKDAGTTMDGARQQLQTGIQTSLLSIDEAHRKLSQTTDAAVQQSVAKVQAQLSALSAEHRTLIAGQATQSAAILAAEREALVAVLGKMQAAFQQEADRRKALETASVDVSQRLMAVLEGVTRVSASNAATEAGLRGTTIEAVCTMGSSLEGLKQAMTLYQESNHQLHSVLQGSLQQSRTEETRFFEETDKHLATIFNGMHQMLEAILRVTQQIRDAEARRI